MRQVSKLSLLRGSILINCVDVIFHFNFASFTISHAARTVYCNRRFLITWREYTFQVRFTYFLTCWVHNLLGVRIKSKLTHTYLALYRLFWDYIDECWSLYSCENKRSISVRFKRNRIVTKGNFLSATTEVWHKSIYMKSVCPFTGCSALYEYDSAGPRHFRKSGSNNLLLQYSAQIICRSFV